MDIAQISPYYYRPAPEIISNGSAVMTWQGCCTMSPERSALLNQKLPDDLAALAMAEGVNPKAAWLTTSTDLNLEGHYDEVFLLVLEDRLVTLGRPTDKYKTGLRISLHRPDVKEIATRQGIGGGFIEALVDDVYVEVLAYSNSRADLFAKVAAKLKTWCKGDMPGVGPEDDEDPRRCPKCGMSLEFKGDICRRCIKSGAVLLRVLTFMRPYAGKAVLMLLLVFAGIGLSLVPQMVLRMVIDDVLAPSQAGNPVLGQAAATQWLLWLVAALFGVALSISLLNSLSGRLVSYVGSQIAYDMRLRVFRHLIRLGVGYYDRYNVGQLMTRVNSDTAQFQGFISQLTSGFMAQIITLAVVGVTLFSLNWKLALITLVPAPFVALATVFFWKRIYPRYYRVWDATSKLNGVLNTILTGVRVVKAFGREKSEENRFDRSTSYVRDSSRRVEYTTALFYPAIGLLFQMGGFLVWFIGGQWVLAHEPGGLTLGALMQFLGYLGMFYAPLSSLTQLTNWLTQFLTASQRTFEILDTQPQIVETAKRKPLPDRGGAIRFENVTFGYSRHEPVIRGVTFQVKPGEHVGIVGKSGSGKTTLINLLARFYDLDQGRILIDDVDIRDLKLADLRRYVGVVLQEPFLFRGTIYENITYGRNDATPEEVLDAAKAANAHNFIIRHVLGYDTYIGERGAGLSGGERQRISIARALLYDPKILILDEATSNIDTESEMLIQEALGRVTRNRTTLTIAHRLSTLKNSDRILVVDDGRLIEQGTHDELLAHQGLYYRLVKIQTELAREPGIQGLMGAG